MMKIQGHSKRLKTFAGVCLMLVVLIACTGWGKKTKITRQDIADDYAVIALQKEEACLSMEQAVAEAEKWLSRKATADEADKALEKLYNKIYAVYKELDSLELSSEMKQALREYGISPSDYTAMADERISDFNSYCLNIAYMRAYIRTNDRDGLKDFVAIQNQVCKIDAEYNAWSINYLFCGWSGDALDYVQENIVDKLAEGHQLSEWLTERSKIEENAAECLDELEKLIKKEQQQVEKKKLALEREMLDMGV